MVQFADAYIYIYMPLNLDEFKEISKSSEMRRTVKCTDGCSRNSANTLTISNNTTCNCICSYSSIQSWYIMLFSRVTHLPISTWYLVHVPLCITKLCLSTHLTSFYYLSLTCMLASGFRTIYCRAISWNFQRDERELTHRLHSRTTKKYAAQNRHHITNVFL